jgi:hypothetical protein
MCLAKKPGVRVRLDLESPGREARHHVEQHGDVILGLAMAVGRGDAERAQVVAHASQGPLVEEAGQIIGGVGQQFAASHADEKVEELALDLVAGRESGGLRERAMRTAEGLSSPSSVARVARSSGEGTRPRSDANRSYSRARSTSISSTGSSINPPSPAAA